MNRIPKAVYTKEFREDAVKLAMTRALAYESARWSTPPRWKG